MKLAPGPCYDHVQLRALSGYSGHMQLYSSTLVTLTYSGHGRAVMLPLTTTLGLIPVQCLLHLTVYPALT